MHNRHSTTSSAPRKYTGGVGKTKNPNLKYDKRSPAGQHWTSTVDDLHEQRAKTNPSIKYGDWYKYHAFEQSARNEREAGNFNAADQFIQKAIQHRVSTNERLGSDSGHDKAITFLQRRSNSVRRAEQKRVNAAKYEKKD